MVVREKNTRKKQFPGSGGLIHMRSSLQIGPPFRTRLAIIEGLLCAGLCLFKTLCVLEPAGRSIVVSRIVVLL